MASKKKAPWERSAPKKVQKRGTKHLSASQKKHAAQRAKKAGRPYPNMVDNMHEAQQSGSKKKASKKGASKKTASRKSATKKTTSRNTTGRRTASKKTESRKTATKRASKTATKRTNRRSARKRTSAKRAPAKRASGRKKATRRTKPREKDPRGGLTAAGRRAFHDRDGSNLKPGVKKKASEMSRSDMKRKGSWAVRFYGRRKLPALTDEHGQPTRFALSAAAWGEPVPKTEAAARKIADRGHRLLERARG